MYLKVDAGSFTIWNLFIGRSKFAYVRMSWFRRVLTLTFCFFASSLRASSAESSNLNDAVAVFGFVSIHFLIMGRNFLSLTLTSEWVIIGNLVIPLNPIAKTYFPTQKIPTFLVLRNSLVR